MIELLTDKTGWQFAVVKDDDHASVWCREQSRLDYDRSIDLIIPMLKQGDVVVDAGANIGCHTVPYANAVGENGKIFSFEPNPDAFDCLSFNCRNLKQVELKFCALGEKNKVASLRAGAKNNPKNTGAFYLVEEPNGKVEVLTLDSFGLQRCNFVKIDVEGYELFLLHGAIGTIQKFRPIIFCELNDETLSKNNCSKNDILNLMRDIGYTIKLTEPRASIDLEQVDIFFMPLL